jgi:predicted PurR-regulated permease PerM
MMRDWNLIMARILDMVPRDVEPSFISLCKECDEVLGAFLRGQLLIMILLGIVYAIGLYAVGLDLAILIGMLAGLASIVPYLGFFVGIVVASIAAMFQFQDPVYLGYIGVVFLIGQALEGWVLTPWLVGDKIGLHPVAVIFAVLAGGQLFGFVGILLALPLAAVVMVFVRYLHKSYLGSEYYGTTDQNLEAAKE